MTYSRDEILAMMNDPHYPLSSKYDPDWILEHALGSHCLWLQEALTQALRLTPRSRVLDLGCGKAISSIFLAREFGVNVWAADLWNDPTENWRRIRDMGVAGTVCPVRADANALPFADGYLDALTTVNSLMFYVTDGDFLREKILRFLRPGGEIAAIVPSFRHEVTEENMPEAYRPFWEAMGLKRWHTLEWWMDVFRQSGCAEILVADHLEGDTGTEIFQNSMRVFNAHEEPCNLAVWDEMTFSRIVVRRKVGDQP